MARLRSPICWFGGKGNLLAKLLPLIPEHHIYCEVFGGGAALLMAKEPSAVEVYNDLDGRLVNLFKVLRDPVQFSEFERLASLTLFSRRECWEVNAALAEGNSVERAWRLFVATRQGFGGQVGSWGYGRNSTARGMAAQCSKWLSTIDLLPEMHERLMRVQIEEDDWQRVLERYDTERTFFYLDPPYAPQTRKSGGYLYEMDAEAHGELVERVQGLKGKVLVSGYGCDAYGPLERSWRSLSWRTACHAAGRTRGTGLLGEGAARRSQGRVERVWMNYG